MLKAAIIGCGSIATVHKRVLTALPEAKLIACCDVLPGRAKEFAENTDIHPYEKAEEMMIKERPDVVHICVPHPLHTPLAKFCVSLGAHVFTEKPPAVSLEQWNSFYQLRETDKFIGVCFQNRYNSSVQRIKKLIASGEIGELVGARAFLTWNRTKDYYLKSDWRGSWKTEGGGVLINQAIHTLDLLVYLFGAVENVKCHMSNHSLENIIEVEDTTEAYISFESGIRACFYATNAYCCNAPVFIEIVAGKAILRMEGNDLTIQWKDGRAEQVESNSVPQFEKDYWGNSHYDCIQDFYRAILEDRPYGNDIESVKETMKLMLKMYETYRDIKVSEC